MISIHALLAESDIVTVGLLMFSLYFYPRSPCGERPIDAGTGFFVLDISIHALLAESDAAQVGNRGQCAGISIHALLAESDGKAVTTRGNHRHFYPRSPCGERLGNVDVPTWIYGFLSTLSLRRATLPPHKQKRRNWISIHALLAESDRQKLVL